MIKENDENKTNSQLNRCDTSIDKILNNTKTNNVQNMYSMILIFGIQCVYKKLFV